MYNPGGVADRSLGLKTRGSDHHLKKPTLKGSNKQYLIMTTFLCDLCRGRDLFLNPYPRIFRSGATICDPSGVSGARGKAEGS